MKNVALMVALCLIAGEVHAGWYRVTNYLGQIGPYPIHLSMQVYDFGPGGNVQASYYYDRWRTPIPLVGKSDGSRVTLCDVHDPKAFTELAYVGSPSSASAAHCPLQLDLSQNDASGRWSDDHGSLPVQLKRVGRLDETGTGVVEGVMEVPFWGSTVHDMFVGIYQQPGATEFSSIRVIDKKTGATVQTITPPDDCLFGQFMTSIYMNLQSAGEARQEKIALNCSAPTGGLVAYYLRNDKSGKFEFAGMPMPADEDSDAADLVQMVVGSPVWEYSGYVSGSDWLALACDAKGCALEPAHLTVQAGSPPGQAQTTVQQLNFALDHPDRRKPLAWLRRDASVRWLRPGPVVTYGSTESGFHRPRSSGTWEVEVTDHGKEVARLVPLLDQSQQQAVLQLRSKNARQLLENLWPCPEEEHADYLLWAGDLDHDGKPDYLVNYGEGYGEIWLYLSSSADSGNLVGAVAKYQQDATHSGCPSPQQNSP